jgi:uncharacterized protein
MSEETPAARAKGPWGALATIGFTILIFAVFTVAQIVVAIPYMIVQAARTPGTNAAAVGAGLEKDGLFLALSEVVAGPAMVGLTILFAVLRKGPSLREYLALWPVARRTTLGWLLGTVLLAGLLDIVAHFAGYPSIPDWMLDVYRSARFLPLLFFAIVVVAPVMEEIVFRGFFYEGLRHSRLGSAGAILLASLVWASIHLQYEWFYIGQVFVVGLLFGAIRWSTGSLIPAILAHALMNLAGMLQTALQLRPWSTE